MAKQLLVLVGSQGSGKTFFANTLKENDCRWEIVSSDTYRIAKHGGVNIFRSPIKTFNAVDRLVCKALMKHDFVCYDACSITRFRRARLLRGIRRLKCKVIVTVVVFRVPYKVCVERDKSLLRDHHVGRWIIMCSKFLTKLNRPNISEGFDVITTPSVVLMDMKCHNKSK